MTEKAKRTPSATTLQCRAYNRVTRIRGQIIELDQRINAAAAKARTKREALEVELAEAASILAQFDGKPTENVSDE